MKRTKNVSLITNLSDIDGELFTTGIAVSDITIFLPLSLALSCVDNLQGLVFPAQLLQPSLQLLNTMLLGDVLLQKGLFLFLLCQKPAPKICRQHFQLIQPAKKVLDKLHMHAAITYFSN